MAKKGSHREAPPSGESGPLLSFSGFKAVFFDKTIERQQGIEIFPGERWALMGPSGSGKTLLLRALALLEPLVEGRPLWKGREVEASQVPQFRCHVMYLQQNPSFFEGTVERNLELPYQFSSHAHKTFDRKRILHYLESFHLGEKFLHKSTHHLSGGERQMVALLRLLQLDPEILLLDEPTAALDQENTLKFEALLAKWLEEVPRRAFIWVTHSSDQAARVAKGIWQF